MERKLYESTGLEQWCNSFGFLHMPIIACKQQLFNLDTI